MGVSGHKLVPRWHAGVAGNVFSCYDTTLAPILLTLDNVPTCIVSIDDFHL